ncbi:uncharacterized protein LOC120352068 [Nilaparvata lugens]|uniref:uncharacterized protein LOC120352068 n=1 Tax=Nilaparvata lugens TaxID=108931 RepID=UPI00193D17D0|nr:uncharacterized protein LOC120352068 [Nilaparvata lugens]
MATSKPLPHELLKCIPRYDGTAYKLPHFISTCEDLQRAYCTDHIVEKEGNHWLLFKTALCHLEGPAEAVAYNNSCSTLTELINSLKQNFADNRPVPELIAEISAMCSFNREHPIDFLNRLEEKRTHVITKYKIDGVSGELLTNLIHQLNATLVNTFVHGVHPTLGSHLQVLQIQNLDDARSKLINDCSIVLNQLNLNRTENRFFQASNTFRTPNYESSYQSQSRQNRNTQNFFQSRQRRFQNNERFYQPHFQQQSFYSPPSSSQPHNFQQSFSSPNFQQQRNLQQQNFQQRFPQQQNFQQRFPQQQNSNFKPSTPINNSSNTVSMRTQRTDPVQKLRNYKSPYEVNYLEEDHLDCQSSEYTQNPIQNMQSQLDTLTESLNKLTDHFLGSGPRYATDPPSDST